MRLRVLHHRLGNLAETGIPKVLRSQDDAVVVPERLGQIVQVVLVVEISTIGEGRSKNDSDRFRRNAHRMPCKLAAMDSLSASSAKIPVEVDHDLDILVLSAYRLSERGESPSSTLPANRSQ